ncbi:STAS domain-containing protein [Mixta intestinalis]|jgi:anti-sigma B factor antagonist|uniref:Anti-sigma factor antagonist n=1 Tax=Mixta intestinalis TaxID=1615494 RepID=A0A6P1PYB9_9GAMM|nr:STAS domain-containing protein [Mixta intestinalis]QHM71024.1 Putative anti-sigma factor antagonist [Mixta intestinalis]
MKLEIAQSDNVTVITPVTRRLDASVAKPFRDEVMEQINAGQTRLLLDFSRVDFIDSSCLGTLISLLKAINGKGEMALCALNPNIQNMFKLTRMDRVFTLCTTQNEALSALHGKG